MENRPRAHEAGFEGDIEAAAGEPIVSEHECCGAQGLNLSMGCRVFMADRAVEAGSNHGVFLHHDRPHRHFTELRRPMRLLECQAHEVLVGHGDLEARQAPEHPESTNHFDADDEIDELHGLCGRRRRSGLNIHCGPGGNKIEEVDDILAPHADTADGSWFSHAYGGGAAVKINVAAHGVD